MMYKRRGTSSGGNQNQQQDIISPRQQQMKDNQPPIQEQTKRRTKIRLSKALEIFTIVIRLQSQTFNIRLNQNSEIPSFFDIVFHLEIFLFIASQCSGNRAHLHYMNGEHNVLAGGGTTGEDPRIKRVKN